MSNVYKGLSPFTPNQPVPARLFAGRAEQLDYIEDAGIAQVALGKPEVMFIEGDFGIGKSSIARKAQDIAADDYKLLPVTVSAGGIKEVTGIVGAIQQALIQSLKENPDVTTTDGYAEKLKDILSKLAKLEVGLFTAKVAIGIHSPSPTEQKSTTQDVLNLFEDILGKFPVFKGIFLVIEEIAGLVTDEAFCHFLKGLSELNTARKVPIPFLLMLCGLHQHMVSMGATYPPLTRLFQLVEIEKLEDAEVNQFFTLAFGSVEIELSNPALNLMMAASQGMPNIMQLVGHQAFLQDEEGYIQFGDAFHAVRRAANEFGKKTLDKSVYEAIRSPDYRSILDKIGKNQDFKMDFLRSDLEKILTPDEHSKLGNFLARMKKLNVICSGESSGAYRFTSQLTRVYIGLQALSRE